MFIHARAIRADVGKSCLISLITLYSKAHLPHYSVHLFNTIRARNDVSWSALISASAGSATAFHHFISMLRQSILPNSRIFATLFRTCASVSSLPFALQLHSLSRKLPCVSDPYTSSALVSLYCKSGITDDARKAFEELSERDEVCYCSIINGLAQNGKPFEALCYFARMRRHGVGSRIQSVSGALKAVSELAMLEQCRIIHGHAVVSGWGLNVIVGTALIDTYGKCGLVVGARGIFDELEMELGIIGWNAMMAGYAQQGDKDQVVELFGSMVECGLKPDDYSCLAVLTVLHNSGLALESQRWIRKMNVDYQIEPKIEHYTCLIGSLGKDGQLEEAERLALRMPYKPDAAVWRVLLSTSAYHGNADMAWKMGQKLLELVPNDDSAYVIALNAFAAAERWDNVKDIWVMMKEKKVRKKGGRSWVEVQGEVHEFIAGDRKHERKDEIYKKLAELMEEIEKLGYEPVWDEMLHDVDKKEKKEALRFHGEKLALAFSVLCGAAPPGEGSKDY